MKNILSILPIGLLCVLTWLFFRGPAERQTVAAPAAVKTRPAVKGPPPVPESDLTAYTPLGFQEIFRMPAGPEGLEETEKLLSLAGGQVRMEGFMVRHPHEDPSVFLFTPSPMTLNQREFGLADDLPPSTVHVRLETGPGVAPVFTADKLLICGRLETGARQEADGRISHVRLAAERVLRAADRAPLELLAPVLSQPDRVKSGQGGGKQ